MTAAELLRELNDSGEQTRIEAKLGTEIGTSILETVCAFANEPGLGGGYLLLGVRKSDDLFGVRYQPTGVPDPEKLAEDLVSGAASAFNRPVRVEDVTPEILEGKTVLRAFIPESQPGDKPVFFQRKGLPRGAFRRYGTSDVACTDDDLTLFYAGRSQLTYDANPEPRATLQDISAEAVADYRRARAAIAEDAAELAYSDEDLLRSLGALEEVEGHLLPTIAGLLLFGSQSALRRLYPMVRVDYIRVPGRQWVENPDERFASVDMRGPLMQLVRRAEAAVIDDLPKSFSLAEGSLQRTDVLPIPRRVLREAIVNAVMHRSYREHSPVQIIRYSNRIEIVNPGYSLKPRERLGERRSETRNPVIAAVLHETRFAETKGSGIGVMRKLMEREKLAPPTFDSDREGNEFSVRLLLVHFLSHEDHDWLAQFSHLAPTPEEKIALVFVREVGAIDNATYRELAALDAQQATQSLRRLREADLLAIKGKGGGSYYVAGPALVESLYEEAGSGSGPEAFLSIKEEGLSVEDIGLSVNLGRKALQIRREELPEKLAREIEHLGQRAAPEKVRLVIWKLCRWRSMKAEEIGGLLGRNVVYLLNNYLTPMMREGNLEHTIPDMPRHPNQAYRATAKQPKAP